MKSIRYFSVLVIFLTLTFIGCKNKNIENPKAVEVPKKPNVIFILADDLGYGDVSAYGATKISTPHLDKLAAQ